jgi:chromosome segregation ATPase
MASERSQGADRERVGELLRLNAELAAEIRSLTQERTDAPRSGAGSSGRRVARLVAERDAREAERDALQAQLDIARTELERTERHRDELAAENEARARHIDEMGAELSRLRTGFGGLLRRVRARLLRKGRAR